MSARETEEVLAGRQPEGRADLAALAEVAAVLHASSEVEPPPPMSDALRAQIERGVPRPQVPSSRRRLRHKPRHMRAATPARSGLAAYRRPVASVAAAAAVLIGLVVATSGGHLPREVHSAVADVGSAIGLDLFQREDAADTGTPASTTSSTTSTTAPPTSTTAPPAPSTTAPPPTAQAPGGPPPGGAQLPWWLTPEFWQQYGRDHDWGGGWDRDHGGDRHGRDGDRDGDADGTGTGRGSGDGRYEPHRHGDGSSTTQPPTTASPTSTSTSAAPSPTPTSTPTTA
ncbi:MAG TPA: hypothetical protein VIL48_18815 [Acidimicrobiales bacterium]